MRFFAGLLTLLPGALALGQAPIVTTTAGNGTLQLAGSGVNGQILLSADDWWGVLRAAEDLAEDFGRVTGKNLTLGRWNRAGSTAADAPALYIYHEPTNNINYTVGPEKNLTGPTLISGSSAKTVIIAGTIGKSSIIDELIRTKKIDTGRIKGQWESFISQVIDAPIAGVDRALVIAGSDKRGTIFGLYDVSEQIGVSPWHWFADVPPKKSTAIYALNTRKVQGAPSVKFRGIFINDEQPGLTNWINANYAPGKYGAGYNHYFYSHVFELLLRLRANYIWPAMWGSMFNVDDYANQPLSDAFGIVMGTSHTEPLTRATNEWGTFGKQYGGNGIWAYDTNNASISKFFEYGVQRSAPYINSTLYTMAMRGYHDTAIELTNENAIKTLLAAVAEQRRLLEKQFPSIGVENIPTMWCLYKEVQGYYELGMDVPEDITLLWTDDNWGNIRRLPIGNETARSGGAGVYYHFDYVGDPRSWKWINTVQLQKTIEQMKLAKERGADRIWVTNVGDLKANEIPINHFMDLAYNTNDWSYDSAEKWLALWATREFGANVAADVASIMDRYGKYVGWRKYEVLDPSTYSVLNYNEADAVLAQWIQLGKEAQTVYDKLDEATQVAFYELVLQPVLGGGVVNQIHINAAKNKVYSHQRRDAANRQASLVLDLFKQDHTLTQRHHDLLNGKWNHILDQAHIGYEYWQQPMRNMLPPLVYVQDLEDSVAGSIGIGIEGSNATVSGDDNYHANSGNTLVLPPLDPYGPRTRWLEVFSRGTKACDWSIAPLKPYVTVSPSSGTSGGNGTDTRVYVSVDWSKAPPAGNWSVVDLNITNSCGSWGNYPKPLIQVPVNVTSVPRDFKGYVESNKQLAIEAEHAARKNQVGDWSYRTLKGHGRTLSGVTLVPVDGPSIAAGAGPVLEYDIYTFTNASKANVTLYLSPSQNTAGNSRALKVAVAFDTATPQIKQFVSNTSNGDTPLGWGTAVTDNIWKNANTTTMHALTPGKHTLKIWFLEPAIVLQKIVIDLGGVLPSYFGPPESFKATIDSVGKYEGTNFAGLKLQ